MLSLEEARRRLAQLEEDVKSRAETNKASLLVVEEKRNKALIATQRVQQVIDSLVLRAPLDGVVSLKENRDAAGGMFFGQQLPEYREGDQVGPGRPVADVIEAGPDGGSGQGRRERSRQPHRGPACVGVCRRAARRSLHGEGRGAGGPGQPRLLGGERDPDVRRDLSVRQDRAAAQGRVVGPGGRRWQYARRRPASAAAGGVRPVRQEPCVRPQPASDSSSGRSRSPSAPKAASWSKA